MVMSDLRSPFDKYNPVHMPASIEATFLRLIPSVAVILCTETLRMLAQAIVCQMSVEELEHNSKSEDFQTRITL